MPTKWSLSPANYARLLIPRMLAGQDDRVLYLDDGRILEDGTYDELLAADGKFARFVERQRILEELARGTNGASNDEAAA